MFFLLEQEYFLNERCTRFFLVALSHDTLENYYRTNFAMMQNFKYSLTELNDMMPWEREIYLTLLNEHLKDLDDRRKTDKGTM